MRRRQFSPAAVSPSARPSLPTSNRSCRPRHNSCFPSLGSGFGLLEALLLDSRHVIGVEVKPSPNRHLPSTNHHTVHGSRFLDALAGEAAAWLFVYPRRVGLVDEYLAEYGSRAVQQIVWIGPQADWDDYKRCFRGWDVHAQAADDGGGRACELIAVARKGRD
jgi:hypothetical protein